MELIEAIRKRHSVRRYLDRPVGQDLAGILASSIDRINRLSGLNIQLVLDEPKAFSSGLWKYGQFSGVRNYFVMAGPKGREFEEKIGYYGEELVIQAQALGLNTCWVGLTYKKIPGTFELRDGDMVRCVISLGYGENQGVQHPMRPMEKFVQVDGEMPAWFKAGMEAVMLAPTAVNQQKFKFILHPDRTVEAVALRSLAGYTAVDLGIVKYHFEIGAGTQHFVWKQ